MHTMWRSGKGGWNVGFCTAASQDDDGTTVLFNNVSWYEAWSAVNCLNGGEMKMPQIEDKS